MPSHYVKAGVAGVILRGNQIVMVRRKYGTHKWLEARNKGKNFRKVEGT